MIKLIKTRAHEYGNKIVHIITLTVCLMLWWLLPWLWTLGKLGVTVIIIITYMTIHLYRCVQVCTFYFFLYVTRILDCGLCLVNEQSWSRYISVFFLFL